MVYKDHDGGHVWLQSW